MPFKKCSKCGNLKSTTEFYSHRLAKDGLNPACKECVLRRHRAAYHDPSTGRRAYLRDYAQEHADTISDYQTGYRQKPHVKAQAAQRQHARSLVEPAKKRARSTLGHAIRDNLVTPQPCETCGTKAHAHHEDYSKPLEVRWLCRLHHRGRHMQCLRHWYRHADVPLCPHLWWQAAPANEP